MVCIPKHTIYFLQLARCVFEVKNVKKGFSETKWGVNSKSRKKSAEPKLRKTVKASNIEKIDSHVIAKCANECFE